MEVCLMIEGQENVTWGEDWLALAAACERHGVGTLFRSDHYLSVADRRERGSLDAWMTIAALAAAADPRRQGGARSLRLAARHADEYNVPMATLEEIAEIRSGLDHAPLRRRGPRPASLPLSMMTGWLVGDDRDDLVERAGLLSLWQGGDGDGDAFLADLRPATIAGTAEEAIATLREFEAAGLTRLMASISSTATWPPSNSSTAT